MKSAAPLRTWLITGFILIISIGLLNSYRNNLRSFFLLRKPIEIAFEMATDGDIKVVLLCSSHGKEGLSDPQKLTEIANENESGLSYSFVKVSRNSALLEDFTENEHLISEICSYKPDYLIMQESYSMFDREKTISSFGLQNDVRLGGHIRAFLTGTNDVYEGRLKNHDRQFDPEWDTTYAEIEPVFRSEIKPSIKMVSKFVEGLDTELIMLHIPLAPPIEQKIDSLRNTNEYQSLFNELIAQSDLTYFEFKEPMPFKYFHDISHLNNEGEKIYTDWFIRSLHEFHLSQTEKNH